MRARGVSVSDRVLTVVVAAGLAIDAFVHFDLASAFAKVKTSTMSQADLFRVDAVAAIIVGLALLVLPRALTAGLAFLVAAGGTVAVVLYRYVDVGTIGPIPNMYDPYWQPIGKALSAVGEAVAAVVALYLFLRWSRGRRTTMP
jgi:hypothetical protein